MWNRKIRIQRCSRSQGLKTEEQSKSIGWWYKMWDVRFVRTCWIRVVSWVEVGLTEDLDRLVPSSTSQTIQPPLPYPEKPQNLDNTPSNQTQVPYHGYIRWKYYGNSSETWREILRKYYGNPRANKGDLMEMLWPRCGKIIPSSHVFLLLSLPCI